MNYAPGKLVVILTFLFEVLCENRGREYWLSHAHSTLERRFKDNPGLSPETQSARNIIVFIGDGMGMTTLTAARILKGQRMGRTGEEAELQWDNFPTIGLAKTYNADAQVGESSACATALWCGVKANYETVGLDSGGKFGDCITSFGSRVDSILTWAQEQGKSTGIVTTTRLSHATPAPLYAHSPSRYWEDDGKVPPQYRRHCKDIVRQLVEDEPGKNINVLLGGGRRHWLSINNGDPENPDKEGRRLDGRNLIKEWLKTKEHYQQPADYVWTKRQLLETDSKKIDYLLGMFSYSHMDFETDRNNETEPSLVEMVQKALEVLSKNHWGYLLVVESGRIDHAHHYNNAYRALDETLSLEQALTSIIDHVDLSETLVIVTSDHSHVMTFGGTETKRGNPIFNDDSRKSDVDNLPYTTLLYGNGPGFGNDRHDSYGKDTVQSSAVPRNWATHGGEDVPVFSTGPLSGILGGSYDQSYIAHAIAYIGCLGHYRDRCGCGYSQCDNGGSGNVTYREIDNYVMVSDQDVIAHMRLYSYATPVALISSYLYFVIIFLYFVRL